MREGMVPMSDLGADLPLPSGPPNYLPATQYLLDLTTPPDWVDIARYLQVLAQRPAMKGHDTLAWFLRTVSTELFQNARERGEPTPELTADELATWDRHFDEVRRDNDDQRYWTRRTRKH